MTTFSYQSFQAQAVLNKYRKLKKEGGDITELFEEQVRIALQALQYKL